MESKHQTRGIETTIVDICFEKPMKSINVLKTCTNLISLYRLSQVWREYDLLKTMNLVFILLSLIIVLYVGSNEAKCHKNTVTFQNNLALSFSILKVHCKSRNDDLGYHFVKFKDVAYNFSFHDHVILKTRFKCILWKGANLEYHKNFTAYEGDPYGRCGALYTWVARDDAIYFSTKGKPEKLMYSWIKD